MLTSQRTVIRDYLQQCGYKVHFITTSHKQGSFRTGEFMLKFLRIDLCVRISKEQEQCELGTWVWALVQPLVRGSGFRGL